MMHTINHRARLRRACFSGRISLRPYVQALVAVALAASVSTAFAQVQFEDATAGAGISYAGESYGASVGDVNGDGLPDFFVNRHRSDAALLINRGNGTFEDRNFQVDEWQVTPHSDMHGGSFADIDSDGDKDLFISAGATNSSQMLINDGGLLSNRIHEFSFDVQRWGGRHGIWFDSSKDGKLDLGVAVQGDLIQMLEQTDGDFSRINFYTGHQCRNNDFAILSDMNLDGFPDLVCTNHNAFPQRVYDFSGPYPFEDISSIADAYANVVDVAVADLDGDLIPEFFGPRGRARIIGAEQTGSNSVETHQTDQNGTWSTVTFRTPGIVTIVFHWNAKNSVNIHIGADDRPAPGSSPGEPLVAVLDPADSRNNGMPPYDPAETSGIFIGYNPATQTWTMTHASGTRTAQSYLYTFIDSTEAIADLGFTGKLALDQPREPLLLRHNPSTGRYEHNITGTGLEAPIQCVSAVAADFDNDMDEDLFLVCRNAVSNAENILYVNDGSGHFIRLADAGGAAGPTGFGVGLSENVVTTDYDADGFVDLFVTNGLKLLPEHPYGTGGPDKLFRNLGNGNQWLELELVGTDSNCDAVGAIVTVTAGGKSQRKEQNGGYHRWAQNDQRLHFGLAQNTTANVQVQWPSGRVDFISGLTADRVYRLTEGEDTAERVFPGSATARQCSGGGGASGGGGGSVGDYVWRDADGDGVQDAAETGWAGVTVKILNCQGPVLGETLTDGAGAYRFDGLAAGSYQVQVTLPSGATFSPKAAGTDTERNSDVAPATGMSWCTTITSAGEQRTTLDAGLVPSGGTGESNTGSVGDYVWRDADGDGIQDSTEAGWAGVVVKLRSCNGLVLSETVTDSTGRYQFPGLAAGSYQVQVILPSGATFSPKAAGTDTERNSDVHPGTGTSWCTTISSAGEQRTTLDAGLVPSGGTGGSNTGSVGDYVWRDADGDGVQDSTESGWSGVSLNLRSCNGPILDTTVTDSAGHYEFAGLPVGTYQVQVILPSGATFSPKAAGTDTERNSDVLPNSGISWCTTISSAGEQRTTLDAGLVPTQ